MINQYGFIVKADNYHGNTDSATLNTTDFSPQVVGVSSDEEAIVAARKMIEEGIQVIEVCGGFGEESAQYVSRSLDTDVPIGYVTFHDDEQFKLDKMLSRQHDF